MLSDISQTIQPELCSGCKWRAHVPASANSRLCVLEKMDKQTSYESQMAKLIKVEQYNRTEKMQNSSTRAAHIVMKYMLFNPSILVDLMRSII